MNYKIATKENQFLGKGFDEILTAEELDGWDIAHLVVIGTLIPVEVTAKKESK